jgi:hypothetical protein
VLQNFCGVTVQCLSSDYDPINLTLSLSGADCSNIFRAVYNWHSLPSGGWCAEQRLYTYTQHLPESVHLSNAYIWTGQSNLLSNSRFVALAHAEITDFTIAELVCNQAVAAGSTCFTSTTSITRYYFDPNTRQCSTFQYLGCDGNSNNFATNSECSNFCLSVINNGKCNFIIKSSAIP